MQPEESKRPLTQAKYEKNNAIAAAMKIQTGLMNFESTVQKLNSYDLATDALNIAEKSSTATKIGTVYLLSSHDEYFEYDVKILSERIFLQEKNSQEPRSIVYNLNNTFVLSTDTERSPSLFIGHKEDKATSKKAQTSSRYLYSAKIVSLTGVHRRIFFKRHEEMSFMLDKIVSYQGFNDRSGQYALMRKIEDGAYCKRRIVRHQTTGATFEMRILNPNSAHNAELQFKKEIELLKSLARTRNIVSLIDVI